ARTRHRFGHRAVPQGRDRGERAVGDCHRPAAQSDPAGCHSAWPRRRSLAVGALDLAPDAVPWQRDGGLARRRRRGPEHRRRPVQFIPVRVHPGLALHFRRGRARRHDAAPSRRRHIARFRGGAGGQRPVRTSHRPMGHMGIRLSKLTPRQFLVVTHDVVVTAAALIGSFWLRFDTQGLADRLDVLLPILPGFLLYAAIVYQLFHLYKGKWRFASLPDLGNIFRAVSVLAVSLLVFDYILVAPNVLGTFFFGKLTILLYWLLQMFFLGGPRIAHTYFRFFRTRHPALTGESAPILVLGRAPDVEVLLRAVESGAVRKMWPAGILSPSRADQGQSVRGVSVMGTLDDLEPVVAGFAARGRPISRLVMTPSALD